jgi:hypothetical protein
MCVIYTYDCTNIYNRQLHTVCKLYSLQTVSRVRRAVSSRDGGRKKMRARYITWGCGDDVQAQEQGEGMMGGEIAKVVKVAMSEDIEDMSHGQEQQPPPPPSDDDVNTNVDLVPHGIHTCWECRKGKFKTWKCSAKRCRSHASSGVIPKVGIIASYTCASHLD